ncbi:MULTISPECIES: hypothetical protein [unclassified Brevibacterium]|uniref:hypothetical protein n=1 Tax=unclassified Brevibacterium TaxID=2614124 RepID=UPI001E31C6FD|nr:MULTISPECIES: hypothetical protein [unclassified Brevibacterium]MCD1287297.1 hypothetical protein [Brevibacterium sp. CCUG 69071]MDK8436449.1 hypothetical protein [Brevibacterium sp. H-BE7]
MTRQGKFLLTATALVVVGLATLIVTGAFQYTTDRNHHRQSTTVTNDHVTNFPWSLLPEDKQ